MAVKKYSLTKLESDRLSVLLGVAQSQQEIMSAITERYKAYLFTIFRRLKIDERLFPFSKVNLGAGELLIEQEEVSRIKPLPKTPPGVPKMPQKAEVKGK